jgi:predicted NBD/HSP70 family sugar kinase
VIASVEDMVRSLLESTAVPPERIAGIGVASPGPVDAAHGRVVDAPGLPGWDVVELRKELELRFATPVSVEKDNIAAAAGEVWKAPGEDENLAFIYLGSGVSAGLVLDGSIVRGAGTNVGDIGHMSGDPDGPICQCGGRGCITDTALPAVLVGEATARGVLPAVDLEDAGAVEKALAELGRLAEEQSDSVAAEIIERTARSFGRVCAQLANLLDLDAIVLGGPQWPALRPSFLRVLPSLVNRNYLGRTSHVVQVRGTSIGEHVGAAGAASLVMWETMFDPPKQLYIS